MTTVPQTSDPEFPACPTYEDICTFCLESRGAPNAFMDLGVTRTPEEHVLLESEHFVVVPCVGALTDWYVLIVPRRHVLSTGWMTAEERDDLRSLSSRTRAWLTAQSGHEVVTFEHGSYNFRDKGGACHDHAHIHLVATPRPVVEFIDHVRQTVTLAPTQDWVEAAHETVDGELRSYLALSSRDGDYIAHSDHAPSGFFRKSLMLWLGEDPAQHDWLVYPQTERLQLMVAAKDAKSA